MRRSSRQRLLGCLVACAVALLPMAAASADEAVPPGPSIVILIRSTLVALNQANETGDYSVLQALGTEAFARENSAEALARRFKPWRDARRGFAFVAIADPSLTRPAWVAGQRLHLEGAVPTPTFLISFDLAFDKVGDRWLLADLAISDPATRMAEEVAAATEAPAPVIAASVAKPDAPKAPEARAVTVSRADPPMPRPRPMP